MRKATAEAAMHRAIAEAVRREGSRTAVAEKLGVKRQALAFWNRVPGHRVLALEALSGVSRYELRPDIYGPNPSEVQKLSSPHPKRHVSRVAA